MNLQFDIFALVNDVFEKRYHNTMSSANANTRIAQFEEDVRRLVDIFNNLAFLAQVEIRTVPSV
jgi:predicted ArsR family transcriptional regulator